MFNIQSMQEKTIQSLRFWVKHFPDSDHPCDMLRFYNLIDALAEEDFGVWSDNEFELLIQEFCPQWTPEYISNFLDRWLPKIELVIGYIQHVEEGGNRVF